MKDNPRSRHLAMLRSALSVFHEAARLFSIFLRFSRWGLPTIIALSFLASGIEVLGIAAVMPLLQVATGSEQDATGVNAAVIKAMAYAGLPSTLTGILLIIITLFLIKALLSLLIQLLTARVNYIVRLKVQTELLRKIQTIEYGKYFEYTTGRWSTLMTRDTENFTSAFFGYAKIASDSVSALLFCAAVVSSSIAIIPIAAALLLPSAVMLNIATIFIRRYSFQYSDIYEKSSRLLIELVQNFIYLRTTDVMPRHAERTRQQILGFARIEWRLKFISAIIDVCREPIAILGLCALVYFFVALQGRSLPDVAVLGILLYRLINICIGIPQVWQRLVSQTASIYRLLAAFELPEVRSPSKPATPITLAGAEVKFESVDFRYGESAILQGLDLTISPKSYVGIVGPSGSGKTTFFLLLTGLLSPSAGRITVGGSSLDQIDMSNFRQQLGFVTQEPVAFDDTLRNNLLLWQKDHVETDRKILASLTAASADDLTSKLNAGIGERGANLSGGQKQRLAIARELFKEPGMLIFDEATSALDSENEKIVLDNLRRIKGSVTTLMITHRLASTLDCDIVHVFEHGRIVESGPPRQLLQNPNSVFSRLWVNGQGHKFLSTADQTASP